MKLKRAARFASGHANSVTVTVDLRRCREDGVTTVAARLIIQRDIEGCDKS